MEDGLYQATAAAYRGENDDSSVNHQPQVTLCQDRNISQAVILKAFTTDTLKTSESPDQRMLCL